MKPDMPKPTLSANDIDELKRLVYDERQRAVEVQDFERACQYRDLEAKLAMALAPAPDVGQVVECLRRCATCVDTAAMHGLPQQLPPAYRDSWAEAHAAAETFLASISGGDR